VEAVPNADYYIDTPTCPDVWRANTHFAWGAMDVSPPDGDAFVAGARDGQACFEMIGACLVSPLQAGVF